MERLSVLDAEFLHIEDDTTHMHIAGVSIFDGPTPSTDDLTRLLGSKLHLIPRYRQRVRSCRSSSAGPSGSTTPFRPRLPRPPHGPPTARRRCSAVRAHGSADVQPLDRNRPLWEAGWSKACPTAVGPHLEGAPLHGRRRVGRRPDLGVLLDLDPEAGAEAPPWSPRPEPSGLARRSTRGTGLAADTIDLTRTLFNAVGIRSSALVSAATPCAGLLEFGRHLGPTPPLSIEGTIGPYRTWAHTSGRSTTCARSGRLRGHGQRRRARSDHQRLPRALAVARRGRRPRRGCARSSRSSVRGEDGHGARQPGVGDPRGAPGAIDDPVVRLESVHRRMDTAQVLDEAEAGEAVTTLGGLAPPMVVGRDHRLRHPPHAHVAAAYR